MENIIPTDTNRSSTSILKKILLNHHIYEVKSLQHLCIDFFNANGSLLLDTILYVPNASPSPIPSEPDSVVTHKTFDVHSIDLETADETSHTEDTRTEPDTSVKLVKKKRSNPLRDYIKRRKKRIKPLTSARSSPVGNSFGLDCDSESQDSFNLSTPLVSRSKRHEARPEKKPVRSSGRILKAPVCLDPSSIGQTDVPAKRNANLEIDETDSKSNSQMEHRRRSAEVKSAFKKPISEIAVVPRPRKRSTHRINYSEALVDEALMYEEMLFNKANNDQTSFSNAAKSKTVSVPEVTLQHNIRTHIPGPLSFTAVRSQLKLQGATLKSGFKPSWPITKMANRECSIEQIPANTVSNTTNFQIDIKPEISTIRNEDHLVRSKFVSVSDIKNQLKCNPDSVLSFNSSVSITLTGGNATPKPTARTNLVPKIETPVICQYCDKKCANMKQLAVHQMKHFRLQTHRVGSKQILHPKLRRGRMVPVGTEKHFRCLNCWRLHPNSQSILEHWTTGKCLHYCSICGQSFHENPKLIREHFMVAHKIRYKVHDAAVTVVAPSKPAAPVPSQAMPVPKLVPFNRRPQLQRQSLPVPPASIGKSRVTKVLKSGRVTCEICKCSFPNMHSRNSHMRLHKNSTAAADVKQKGSKDAPFYQLEFKPTEATRSNRSVAAGSKVNGGASQFHRPNQLKQLLMQKPRPLNFMGNPRPRSDLNRRAAATRGRSETLSSGSSVSGSSLTIKSEPSPQLDADSTFHDFLNAAMFSAETEYVDTDYSALMTPILQSDGLDASAGIKVEPTDGPRIQLKKLTELQGSSHSFNQPMLDPYYDGTNGSSQQHTQTNMHQHQHHSNHQPLPQAAPQQQTASTFIHVPHHDHPSNQAMLMHPGASHQMIGQSQQMQQFQISQVQQMQNAQYYNPVFVVQQPSQQLQPPHPQPSQAAPSLQPTMQPDLMYQQPYGNDPFNTDYSKFFS